MRAPKPEPKGIDHDDISPEKDVLDLRKRPKPIDMGDIDMGPYQDLLDAFGGGER